MATSKPDILIILLQKLMEEGNVMYKVSGFVSFCAAAVDLGLPLNLLLGAVAMQDRNFARMEVPKTFQHDLLSRCLLMSKQLDLNGKGLLFELEDNSY